MRRSDTNEEIDLIPLIMYDGEYYAIEIGLEYYDVGLEIWLEKDGKKMTWQGGFYTGPR